MHAACGLSSRAATKGHPRSRPSPASLGPARRLLSISQCSEPSWSRSAASVPASVPVSSTAQCQGGGGSSVPQPQFCFVLHSVCFKFVRFGENFNQKYIPSFVYVLGSAFCQGLSHELGCVVKALWMCFKSEFMNCSHSIKNMVSKRRKCFSPFTGFPCFKLNTKGSEKVSCTNPYLCYKVRFFMALAE